MTNAHRMHMASPAISTDSLINSRGVRLQRRGWLPSEPPRALLAVIHGFAEHTGRYVDHARHFTEIGIAVESFDQAGHGLSGGRRGYIRDFHDLVDDANLFLGELRRRYPDIPRFVLGHSLGGAVAAMVAAGRDHDLHGLIMSSPAIALMEPRWLQRSALGLARVFPRLAIKPLNRAHLCTDTRVISAYVADPLTFRGPVAVRTAAEIIRIGEAVMLSARELTLPLLLTHGAEDRITSPDASAEFFRQAASEDKSFSLFKGMYHETFNEPGGRHVIEVMMEFLRERR